MYFIYKPIKIANQGAVFPRPVEGVDLGLSERDGFYLGYTDDPNKLDLIKDYIIQFITNEEAEGFKLLGITQLPSDPSDPESTPRDLTSDELTAQSAASKLIKKLKVRNKLYSNLGSLEDMVADLDKRISLIERMVMLVFNDLLEGNAIDTNVVNEYLPIIQDYLNSVNTGVYKSKIDIDDLNDLVNKIKTRTTMITNIVTQSLSS